jgi:hypothetical protein
VSKDRVTIRAAAQRLGYTEKAIRAKIERGIWVEGLVWLRYQDGRIFIDMDAVHQWGEGQALEPLARSCRSTSAGKASDVGSG